MSKRKLLPFPAACILFFFPFISNGQEGEQSKNGLRNDSLFLEKAIGTANTLYSNAANAKKDAQDLLLFSDTANFQNRRDALFHANQILAVIYSRLGNQDSAIKYYKASGRSALRINDTSLLGSTFHNIALAYKRKGFLLTAMEYLDSSITIRENSGDALGLARAYQFRLVLNHAQGDYGQSFDYSKKCLDIIDTIRVYHGTMQRNIDEIYISILVSLGNTYLEFDNIDSAYSCYIRSRKFMDRSDLNGYRSGNSMNLCDVYIAQKKFTKALAEAEKGIEHSKNFGTTHKIPALYLRIGQALIGQGKYKSALERLEHGRTMLDTIDDNWIVGEFYEAIADAHRKSGNLSESILNSEKADSVESYLLSDEQRKRSDELAARFRFKENEMTLTFTKEKVALQEVIIDQKEKQNTLYALGGAAVSLLLALMIYLFLQLRNQKNKVDELNEQLTEHIDFQNSVSTVLTHDIRNFLNALQVGPDLILRQLDRENIPKAKKLTESLGNKFTGMYEAISNILLWATPQLKSGMAGEAEILDVAKLIQDQQSSLTTLAEERGFSIQYEGPENKSLHAFKAATEVIIRNAALNALNHSGGNQLILSLSVTKEYWSVQIQDNGKGLDEKTQQVLHISQSDMRQRLKGDQSGFGLWIIRFYSEASQAKIDYSFKDGWSTFRFDFPIHLDA